MYKSAKIHRYLSFWTFFWVDSLLLFLVIKLNPSPMYRFYFIWYITTQFMNSVYPGTTFKKYNHVQEIRQWHTFVSVDMNLCIYCYTVLFFCNQNMATENQRWVDVSCLLESGQEKAKLLVESHIDIYAYFILHWLKNIVCMKLSLTNSIYCIHIMAAVLLFYFDKWELSDIVSGPKSLNTNTKIDFRSLCLHGTYNHH